MKKKLYHSLKNIYKNKLGSKSPPAYPNEMLVKICSSKSYSRLTSKLFDKKLRVCEIGCFTGNNMRFFLDKGHKVYGVEINKFLVNLCKKYIKKYNPKNNPEIFVGDNINIPLKNNFIDLLISINTIHYSFKKDIDNTLKNFKRILKKDGIVIIETPAPKHMLFKQSKRIEKLKYKFKLPYKDHREGIYIGLFDNKSEFKNKLNKYFKHVEINRRTEIYPDKTLDFFIAVCRN